MTHVSKFFERFRPVSQALHFLRCDMDFLLNYVVPWQRQIAANFGVPFVSRPVEQGALTYDQKLQLCLPIVYPDMTRIVISATQSDWICLWGNGGDGISGDTIKDWMGDKFGLERLEVVHAMTRDPGSSQFSYNGPGENGRQRYVAAHKESRWEFHQFGEPFPFEDQDAYKERLIKKRLTAELLDRYCREIGIRLTDEDFYFGRTVLLPMRGQPQTRVVSETFGDPDFFAR